MVDGTGLQAAEHRVGVAFSATGAGGNGRVVQGAARGHAGEPEEPRSSRIREGHGEEEAMSEKACTLCGRPKSAHACERCGHLRSAHDDVEGCYIVTGAVPGSMRMEDCDCSGFVEPCRPGSREGKK